MPLQKEIQLRDLGQVVLEIKKRLSKYSYSEVGLSENFRSAYSLYVTKSGGSIDFGNTTAIITNSSGKKIYAPNHWFVLASYAVPLAKEIMTYRELTETIFEENFETLKAVNPQKIVEKKHIYQLLRSKDLKGEQEKNKMKEKFQEVAKSFFSNSGYSQNDCDEYSEFLVKFLTDEEWWLGGKGIERTNDYYVSPVLGVLNLVNASQSYVATITYAYVTNDSLYDSLSTMIVIKSDSIDTSTKEIDDGEITTHNLFGIHIQGKNDALSETNPHICIGWSAMGNLADVESIDDLGALYDQHFAKTQKGRGQDLGQIWRFLHDMKIGDYVIYSESNCFHIGKIISDYSFNTVEYDAQDHEYKNERKVEWLKTNIDRSILSKSFNSALKAGMSLWKLNDYKSEVVDILNNIYIKDEEEPIVEENKKLMSCLEITREPRINKMYPMNFIVYGAPGTGKTYSMVEYALAIIENVTIDAFRAANPNRKLNIARYKELVKAGQIVFTTFHQNYGYEEFIQGLRPDKDSEMMAFKIVDGVFKVIADTALNDTENKNYVIIIDEINRANISKVFGELITLIEEDKRWGELNETSVTLQSGDQFAVPNNLYIVGTMNSADKSISLIDAALRRRFDFIEQKPDSTLVPEGVLRKIFDNINEKLVRELNSTDLLVGHSYFMKKTEKDLCNIFNNNIIPLLYEYFYDNRKKVAQLLKNAIDKSGAQIEIVDEKVGRLRVKDKVE